MAVGQLDEIMSNAQVVGLIPSRLGSSRLPGKALALIEGMPIVIHTAKRAQLSSLLDDVFVCTDSQEIVEACDQYSVKSILTPNTFSNGTERIAYAAELLNYNFYIDIQGDEPLLNPSHVDSVIQCIVNNSRNEDIVIPTLEVPYSVPSSIVRVQSSVSGRVMTLTRANHPYKFSAVTQFVCKHLSIIGFTKSALKFYSTLNESYFESVEGIELLRAIENDMNVFTLPLKGDSFSVDIEDDLLKARVAMKNDKILSSYI